MLDIVYIIVYIIAMYIDVVPNRTSRPAILLRESRRHGSRTIKTTLANMTNWPPALVATIRLALQGATLVPKEEVFAIERSLPHGHVQAVLGTLRQLDLECLLAAKRCRERDLVVAMVVQRLIAPCSKLATTRQGRQQAIFSNTSSSGWKEGQTMNRLF